MNDGSTKVMPVAGSALAGTGLNFHMKNVWFQSNTAVPIIDFGIANGVTIEDCTLAQGNAGLATMAIQFDNTAHLRFFGNHIISGVADIPIGMQFTAGFLQGVRIEWNTIFAGTTGIDLAGGCLAGNCVIQHNTITGRPVTGISDLSGTSWIIDNWISASVDSILHAGTLTNCIANHCVDAAVGSVEAAGTD